MVTPNDFIELAYTGDLTSTGIIYTCKSLSFVNLQKDQPTIKQLRQMVSGVAVELAFRRHLNSEKVPHSNLDTRPFTDPDRYDIAIGGRKCKILTYILTQKNHIRHVRQHPEALLDAKALVTKRYATSDDLNDEDLYIFAFLNALITPDIHSIEKAVKAKQPIYLIRTLPMSWAKPKHWVSLGNYSLKSNDTQEIIVILGGLNANRHYQTEEVPLLPKERNVIRKDFYTLSYIYTPRLPNGILGIHNTITKNTNIIEPREWKNIWVYGMEITLTGYITRREFRINAKHLPIGSQVFQNNKTYMNSLSIPIVDLHPIQDLFTRAKSWKKKR